MSGRDWQTTYPSVEALNIAAFQTLQTWDERLPPPQTAVEHTVRRRIKRRLAALAEAELEKADAAFAARYKDTLNGARDLFKKLGIPFPE